MDSGIIASKDLVCFISGSMIGEITNFRFSIDYGKKQIYGIDSQIPFETVPGITRITGSVSLYRIRGTGGLEGRALIAPFIALAKEKYITLQIIDRVMNIEILKIEQASVTQQSWDISSKSVMSGSFNFTGITQSNELNYQ